jgi:hypothetical protein
MNNRSGIYSIVRAGDSYLSLIRIKPEITRLALRGGSSSRKPRVAKEAFIEEWNKSQHIPSGYNSGIAHEALVDMMTG